MYFVLKLLPMSHCPYHTESGRNTHRFSTNFIFLSSVLVQLFTIQLLGSPPYSGTIFVDPDILTEDDPTYFQGLEDAGQASRTMYDRRSGWVSENAFLFNASFSDLPDVEIQVNPEFENIDAARLEAEKYAPVIGRLPKCLREDVETVWIHKGVYGFGGGNNNLLIHTGQADEYVASGILEETFIHEACHTSLDAEHAFAEEWLAAQIADDAFISTYARDNLTREDIAESFLLYYALRYRAERISESVAEVIQETMPNRIAYFDSLDLGLEDLEDDIWNGSLDLGNSWKWLDWFGTYYQESSNWIYLLILAGSTHRPLLALRFGSGMKNLVGSGLHDRFFHASTCIPPRIGYTGTWIVVGIYATTMTLVAEVGLSFKTDCPLATRTLA